MVSPGQAGKIVAEVDTKKAKGPITKTITVECNDPSTPKTVLQLKANVRAFVEVRPQAAARFNVNKGQELAREFQVVSNEDGPFQVTKIESTNKHVLSTFKKDPASPRQYQVTLTLSPEAPVGQIKGTVTVHTTSEKMPKVEITCQGEVIGAIYYSPKRAHFGSVRPDGTSSTGVPRKVGINLNYRQEEGAFKVTKVDTGMPQIGYTINTRQEGKSYSVLLSYKGGLQLGPFEGKVRVHTDDEEMPVIEIPYRGRVIENK